MTRRRAGLRAFPLVAWASAAAGALTACTVVSGWSDLQSAGSGTTDAGKSKPAPTTTGTATTSPTGTTDPNGDSGQSEIDSGGTTAPFGPTGLPACGFNGSASCQCSGTCNVTCTKANCNVVVPSGQHAVTDCDFDGCEYWCASGSQCETSCSGGGCIVHCAAGAQCINSCAGGDCTFACDPAAKQCSSVCEGGGCKKTAG